MTAPQDRQPATARAHTPRAEARAQLIAELREGVRAIEGTPSFSGAAVDESFDMCPNCVTPWKCNGPHIPPDRAPSGYLVDRAAVLALIEKASEPEGAKK